MQRFLKIFLLLISITTFFLFLGNFNKTLAQSCSVSISAGAVGDPFTVTAANLFPVSHPIRLATLGFPVNLGTIEVSPIVPDAHVGNYTIPSSVSSSQYKVQIDQGSNNWLDCTPNITIINGGGSIPGINLPDSPTSNFSANNLIGNIITEILPVILGLAGFITVIIIIISGIQFMLSSGNPEAAATARGRLIMALIGFAIIALAFALTQIIDRIFLGSSGVF